MQVIDSLMSTDELLTILGSNNPQEREATSEKVFKREMQRLKHEKMKIQE